MINKTVFLVFRMNDFNTSLLYDDDLFMVQLNRHLYNILQLP